MPRIKSITKAGTFKFAKCQRIIVIGKNGGKNSVMAATSMSL